MEKEGGRRRRKRRRRRRRRRRRTREGATGFGSFSRGVWCLFCLCKTD
jgi:hypothetical protein